MIGLPDGRIDLKLYAKLTLMSPSANVAGMFLDTLAGPG